MAEWFTQNTDTFYSTDQARWDQVMRENAKALLGI